jgi:hypothetical protein
VFIDLVEMKALAGLGRVKQMKAESITSKRVSAKHNVKDGFAFLWEHAIFRYPPNENLLTDRYEILQLISSVRSVNLSKTVTIDWLTAALHTGEI